MQGAIYHKIWYFKQSFQPLLVALWTLSALILCTSYWGDVTFQRVIQRRGVYQFALLKGDQHYVSIYFWGIFKMLVMQLATYTVTKYSKLPVMQRNWKVNKKQLRIQTAVWLCVLYSEAGLAPSRMPWQPNSILCISSGNHWKKKYLTLTQHHYDQKL